MKNLVFVIGAILFCAAFASAPAKAIDLNNAFVVGADIGFDLDPDLLAGAVIGEYHVTTNVALGPYITFAGDSDRFLFTTSGIAKYKANLNESAKLKPYGLMGVGFKVSNIKDRYDNWNRETNFLFPIGAGFEYWFMDNVAWGANLVFNVSDDIYLSGFIGIRTKF